MKKEYNRNTTSDMPLDSSFTPQVEVVKEKKTAVKPKISAVGKAATSKTSKTSTAPKSTSKTTPKTSTTKTSSSKSTTAKESESRLRSKLTKTDVGLTDLEKLNEENIKQFRFQSKRNKVVIVVLSVLLAITITAIVVYTAIAKLENNCALYVHGVQATFIVDGEEIDQFRAPTNLQGDSRFIFECKIRIEESGQFNVRFNAIGFQKNEKMNNTGCYLYNTELFFDGEDGYYYSLNSISGNQTILLCQGVVLNRAYQNTLNVDNFRLEFHVDFYRVP